MTRTTESAMMTRQPRQSWLQTKTLELCMGLSRQALEKQHCTPSKYRRTYLGNEKR